VVSKWRQKSIVSILTSASDISGWQRLHFRRGINSGVWIPWSTILHRFWFEIFFFPIMISIIILMFVFGDYGWAAGIIVFTLAVLIWDNMFYRRSTNNLSRWVSSFEPAPMNFESLDQQRPWYKRWFNKIIVPDRVSAEDDPYRDRIPLTRRPLPLW
jgi:hypothetical protein